MDEDAKAAAEAKAKAVQEKELGNAAYKAKKFDEAIKHYNTAIELDDTDISFLTNRYVAKSLPCRQPSYLCLAFQTCCQTCNRHK